MYKETHGRRTKRQFVARSLTRFIQLPIVKLPPGSVPCRACQIRQPRPIELRRGHGCRVDVLRGCPGIMLASSEKPEPSSSSGRAIVVPIHARPSHHKSRDHTRNFAGYAQARRGVRRIGPGMYSRYRRSRPCPNPNSSSRRRNCRSSATPTLVNSVGV